LKDELWKCFVRIDSKTDEITCILELSGPLFVKVGVAATMLQIFTLTYYTQC
jgi:hypothetical protein